MSSPEKSDPLRVSIVIPVYHRTPQVDDCVRKCVGLQHEDLEILVVVDRGDAFNSVNSRLNVLETALDNTGPAEKRDLALSVATGEIIAFLDDDSYPSPDWIRNALKYFEATRLAGICGPGVTPPDDSFWQHVGGAILTSPLGGGMYRYRFKPSKPRYVDDFPTYNMFIRRIALEAVGGFGSTFYGGEDTLLCAKIVSHLGPNSILYVPDVVVYHHRRHWPLRHIRQVSNYGLHRGYFARKHRKTSRRISYFLPFVATFLLVALLIAAIVSPTARIVLLTLSMFVYLAIATTSLVTGDALLIALLLPFAVVSSHLAYGWAFLKGLLVRELTR